MSQHHSSSTSTSLESKGNEEQEQVTIAHVLASLRPSESSKCTEKNHRHGQQRSTPVLWESTRQTPSFYPMRCQNLTYCSFSPEIAMYQIWQQEQLLQQQNHLLSLTIPAATPSAPHIYPFMQSMLQPDCCLYFPGNELESLQMGPKITIAASGPSFCFSNPSVPSSIRGRSTVTIQEIQEDRPEEASRYSPSGVLELPSAGNSGSTELQVLETVQDDKQNLGSLESKIKNLQFEGNRRGQFDWASHRSTDSGFKRSESQLQNSCVDSSRPILRPQYLPRPSSHRTFGPLPSAAAPAKIRTVGPTSSMGFGTQRMVASPGVVQPRMRTGIPSCSTRPPENFNLGGVPPAFMAPAVRIRSVVPVCSAPPVRKMPSSSNDVVSPNMERKI